MIRLRNARDPNVLFPRLCVIFKIDEQAIVNDGCVLLPAAKAFFKHGMKKPLSEKTVQKLEKKARKMFRSANLQPSRISIVYCDHPLVLAEFSGEDMDTEHQNKLANRLTHEAKFKGAALAWMPRRGVQMFEKAAAIAPPESAPAIDVSTVSNGEHIHSLSNITY